MLLLVIVGFLDLGLYQRGQQIVSVVADHALSAARLFGGTTANGVEAGVSAAQQIGGSSLYDLNIQITSNASTVRVRVTAKIVALLPSQLATVEAHQTGPRERYVPVAQVGP
nr:hypothetical protein [Fodinicola acaciae]